MIGTNHALTGGLLAYVLPPFISIPSSLASHFVLDMLPHYGIDNNKRDKSVFWKVFFSFDAIFTLGMAVYALTFLGDARLEIFLCGFFATMPDYIWVARVIKTRSFNLGNNKSKFTRWHSRIQGLERPWGIWLEIPLAVILFYLVLIRLW